LEARIMDRGRPERTTLFEDSQTLVDWEDETGVNIGSKIQLIPPTAPILGPRLSDLTGGDGDYIKLTITPIDVEDITAGKMNTGQSKWILTFTDTSTIEIDMSATDLVVWANAQGMQNTTSGYIDMTTIFDMTPYVGKTIDSVNYSTTFDWTSAGLVPIRNLDFTIAGLQLYLSSANLGTILRMQNGNGGSIGPGLGIVVHNGDFLKIVFDLTDIPLVETSINIPIDATTIKEVATPTQLAEQSNPFEDPIILDNTSLQAYIGWTVTAAVANVYPSGYGPNTMTHPSYLHFDMIFPGHFSSAASNLDDLYDSRPVVNDQPVNLKIWDNTVYLGVYFQFSPTDTPGSPGLPLAYTQPLVIRNRSRMSLLVSSPVSPVGYYATPNVWREFSHDGKLWVFIDGSLPDELNAMLVTGQTWQSLGGIPRDLLQLEESVFRGVFSYAWGKQFSGVVWEFVRFGLQLPTEENSYPSVPAIQATFMARE
jgi:hypothetical protein